MALQVIGAGLGRTGTYSLKWALERLLGGSCYHMAELFEHPRQLDLWNQALDRGATDWDALFAGYEATVDWAGASFYRELADFYPDALVLLSVRDTEEWWSSFEATVLDTLRAEPGDDDPLARAMEPHRTFVVHMLEARFTPEWMDEQACKSAYERHNAQVRASIPAERLLEWHVGAGWDPICAALKLPVPTEPFPHSNTEADFRARRF